MFILASLFEGWTSQVLIYLRFIFPFVVLASLITAAIAHQSWLHGDKKKSHHLFWILLIALNTCVVAYLGAQSYYRNNRTGGLNPYTQECINQGYQGAKGDYCF